MSNIPVSIVIPTKNEGARIGDCLDALAGFDDVWVVDSHSSDDTADIARKRGVHVQLYQWDGRYPKKKQFCVSLPQLKYDWVLIIDADEVVSAVMVEEIAALADRGFDGCCGFFVCGLYVFEGRVLRHGLMNRKLALFDRRRVGFPVLDDLDIEGMGEIEGHYQPVLKSECTHARIGTLDTFLEHGAMEDLAAWEARHLRYAIWEAGMNARRAWPRDPSGFREVLKRVFRRLPFRGGVAFLHCYVLRRGFLDGVAGYRFARLRGRYYRMIVAAERRAR